MSSLSMRPRIFWCEFLIANHRYDIGIYYTSLRHTLAFERKHFKPILRNLEKSLLW